MIKKITIALTAVISFVVIFFVFAFFGNPISKILVTKNAKEYVQENWPEVKYSVEYVKYDFKTSDYYVSVALPESSDNHFTLYCELNGKVVYDTYESAVVNKWNTAGRINEEYRKAVDNIFESGEFPYYSDIAFGDIEFVGNDYAEGEAAADYAIPSDTLILDGEYDIYDMGKKSGCITLYVYDEEVSEEKLAEILLELKKLTDREKVGFRVINCVLERVHNESEVQTEAERVEVMNFSYDDISEKGLVKRVKEAAESARIYLENQDSAKEEAIIGD